MTCYLRLLLLCFVFLLPLPVLAEGQDEPAKREHPLKKYAMPLEQALELTRESTGYSFIVDERIKPMEVTISMPLERMSYRTLLFILRRYSLAAVRSGDIVSIVPVAVIREQPLPVVTEIPTDFEDGEWITWNYQPDVLKAGFLVTMLRSLVPKQGFISGSPQANTLTVVARVDEVRRLHNIIESLDRDVAEH